MKKIAVIVPAYNEEESIESVVREIAETGAVNRLNLTAIVVNDCSSDRTAEIINRIECIPLHLPVNLGIGGAMQTGFQYAYENEFDCAVQVDGDGQHPPHDIPRLLDHLAAHGCSVVIGSRFLEGKGFQSTLLRRIGIRYFQLINRCLLGISVTDCTSGFRLLDRKALAIASAAYPDEYPEPESIVLFVHSGLRICELPVAMRARTGGVSSIDSGDSVYYMFKVSLAILFTYLRTRFQRGE